MGGIGCEISTNSESILAAARESFLPVDKPASAIEFRMRFWVDEEQTSQAPWPKPYVRGLDHMVFAGFESGSSALVDLHTCRVIGRFSREMAADCDYWKTVIFPMLLSIVGGSIGIAEIHCACVAKDQNGLLLAGPSGSGKSTLSVALAQAGFGFLSDDRTHCSLREGLLLAWGVPTWLKLRGEATGWFPALRDQELTEIQNGEPVFRLQPEQRLGLKRVQRCEPRWLVFLERTQSSEFHLNRISSSAAAELVEEGLMAELPEAVEKQSKTIAQLLELPCWLLRYGGPPQAVSRKLIRHFEDWLDHCSAVPAAENEPQAAKMVGPSPPSPSTRSTTKRDDPLRRFTPTPYTAALPVMGRMLRLETNDLRILERAVELFAPYPESPAGGCEFLWRIVSQLHPQISPPWPKRSAFSDRGLRFAQFGQRNFLAVDLAAREGIGFLAEGLAGDELGFTSPFLDNLFNMTAGSLGLVSLRANCVALGEKGLVVFGAHNSGKTTASYIAAKLGLEFHADEGVFMEVEASGLRAWGGFWPVAFRPDTLQFLPELQACARRFSYCDFSFYHLEKQKFQAARAHAVTPVGCVFLERRHTEAVPSLLPISRIELSRRLAECALFKDDDRFAQEQATVFHALAELPAYHLAYGGDPAVAAGFLWKILAGHNIPEQSGPVEVWERNGSSHRKPDSEVTLAGAEALSRANARIIKS